MEKASPVSMREVLVLVENFKRAGILFIPIPVLNSKDRKSLGIEADRRLELIIEQIEKDNSTSSGTNG